MSPPTAYRSTGSAWVQSGLTGKVRHDGADVAFSPPTATAEAVVWPAGPSLTDGIDGDQDYNLGLEFSLFGVGGSCTGFRWAPTPLTSTAPNGGVNIGRLWDAAGNALTAPVTFGPASGGGTVDVSFASPVSLSAATTYVVSVYTRRYVFLSNSTWDETSPSGRIRADRGRLRLDSDGVSRFPGDSFDAIYFISPLVVFA